MSIELLVDSNTVVILQSGQLFAASICEVRNSDSHDIVTPGMLNEYSFIIVLHA